MDSTDNAALDSKANIMVANLWFLILEMLINFYYFPNLLTEKVGKMYTIILTREPITKTQNHMALFNFELPFYYLINKLGM